jgi:hypothetical protein
MKRFGLGRVGRQVEGWGMVTCRGEKTFSILFSIFGFNSEREKEVRPSYRCFTNETMGLNWAFNGPFLNTLRTVLCGLLLGNLRPIFTPRLLQQ